MLHIALNFECMWFVLFLHLGSHLHPQTMRKSHGSIKSLSLWIYNPVHPNILLRNIILHPKTGRPFFPQRTIHMTATCQSKYQKDSLTADSSSERYERLFRDTVLSKSTGRHALTRELDQRTREQDCRTTQSSMMKFHIHPRTLSSS